jgi:hypothetical protein
MTRRSLLKLPAAFAVAPVMAVAPKAEPPGFGDFCGLGRAPILVGDWGDTPSFRTMREAMVEFRPGDTIWLTISGNQGG